MTYFERLSGSKKLGFFFGHFGALTIPIFYQVNIYFNNFYLNNALVFSFLIFYFSQFQTINKRSGLRQYWLVQDIGRVSHGINFVPNTLELRICEKHSTQLVQRPRACQFIKSVSPDGSRSARLRQVGIVNAFANDQIDLIEGS